MQQTTKIDPREVKARVSPQEWEARVNLAAAYRLVAHYRWDDLVFTHISSRVPGEDGRFLINPYGLMFDEITASSLVKIDQDAKIVLDVGYPVNPAGFTIHSAVHGARHDAHCVLHVHELNGIAVSAQQQGLLPLSQQSLFCLASLAYHDYEGVALNEDEKPRLVRDLGDKSFMILRNHGLLTVGPDPAEAFLRMYLLVASCRIQLLAQAGGSVDGGELRLIPNKILAGIQQAALQVTRGLGGALAWPGLLRKLDRLDPSFRE